MTYAGETFQPDHSTWKTAIGWRLALIAILLVGAYFRFTGLNWDESQHLHPDERFLTMVESALTPVQSLGEYFDTSKSTLNPHNVGYGFFVYGTLPIFIVRYLAEGVGQAGYDEVQLVGRAASAAMDLAAVLLVFMTAQRLFRRRGLSLLAAAFYTAAVLPIQLSHYFAVDTFTTTFALLAFYFATVIMTASSPAEPLHDESRWGWLKYRWRSALSYLLFGVAYGMALASKVSIVPLAVLLPASAFVWWTRLPAVARTREWGIILRNLVLAGVVAFIIFRIGQPYAFTGPGFFGLVPNQKWFDNIRTLQVQSNGDGDSPPELQWARRPATFAWENLINWGLGLPLGLLATAGFAWMGWRILRGKWRELGVLWAWTGAYFFWQGLSFTRAMRYQVPIYPLLVIIAAWLVFELWTAAPAWLHRLPRLLSRVPWSKLAAGLIGGGVLIATLAWAFAFTRIYERPMTRVDATRWIYQNVPGPINLHILTTEGTDSHPLSYPTDSILTPAKGYVTPFTARASGVLNEVTLGKAAQKDLTVTIPDRLTVKISDGHNDAVLSQGEAVLDLKPVNDVRGQVVTIRLNPPLAVLKGQNYFLSLETAQGFIAIQGSAPANESTWDDGLPLRMDGLDGYGGIYQSGLNFEMYWADDEKKLARFISTLDSADYIFISSNRQWGTTTRVQERYPLTTAYYRALLGCPADKAVTWCYSVVEPGMFRGQLGFDLVKVFQSDPNLGDFRFNTQFAEEAFTVYDHPKVLIFKKREDYSSKAVSSLLGAVDLSKVVQVTPRKAGVPANLMLPSERLGQQREGGTWSELFDRDSLLNRWPAVGMIAWYLFFLLLGWMFYPLVRLALGGLADRGYPLARLVGLVVLAWVVWIAGSSGAIVTPKLIWLALAGLLALNLALFAIQRRDIIQEIKQQPRYYLLIEALFLAFFIVDLLIRFGNPDLWHPYKGGEKPMDFSYLNAVLKSTSFPPYDPWFAGGTLNYYYYGFVLIGMPIKALGIVPSVAYNLALPMLFAMVASGAFSAGWNLVSHKKTTPEILTEGTILPEKGGTDEEGGGNSRKSELVVERAPLLGGLAAAFAVLILGNLGTINMIWEGFQLLVVPREVMEKADIFSRMGWMFQGLAQYFGGSPLPYNIGEWYWNPSRAIPGEPITEFPFFTFLYADPHAHLYALPVTLLALTWALGIVGGRWNWGEGKGKCWAWLQFGASLGVGALAIGALLPTNTWDMPVYLVLGCAAVLYTALRYATPPVGILRWLDSVRSFWAEMGETQLYQISPRARWLTSLFKFFAVALPAVLLLVMLAFLLYQPFLRWYGQGYTAVELWQGDHTPNWAYRLHWGVFLFLLTSWFVYETVDWMAKTPVSALNKLRPYTGFFAIGLMSLAAVLAFLVLQKVAIAWIPVLWGVWAVILILRQGQSDMKRAALFFTGSALFLTLAVEVIVLKGDVGRMNTVFKFYLQAWILFAVSAAAALVWLLPAILRWKSRWSSAWQGVMIALVVSAVLFPIMAGNAKVQDRMTQVASHTLDGMEYMSVSTYSDQNKDMDLAEDYRAIRWMQENVKGSPVIVEANTPEYRWGSRYTIYTGLPGVVGWNWHQRQQRALTPSEWVTDRVDDIGVFYSTLNEDFVLSFIRRYQVRYIIVGQLERAYYRLGLEKFENWNGKYWHQVYRDGDTAIYEVLQ